MGLTPMQMQDYADNGYLVVQNLVTREELAKLRETIDAIQQGKLQIGAANYEQATEGSASTASAVATRPVMRKLTDLSLSDAFFRSIASKREIVEIVAALTGNAEHVALYADQAMLKPAYHGSPKPLHQDNSYFKVTPMHAGVTCWLAVDDATIENGCMNYVRGSHKLGLIPHKQIANTPHQVPDDGIKIDPETPVPVRAGSAIFHHLLCLHSSKANNSPNARRAWALHYVNAAATCPTKDISSLLRVS